jgi:hypothetical protein
MSGPVTPAIYAIGAASPGANSSASSAATPRAPIRAAGFRRLAPAEQRDSTYDIDTGRDEQGRGRAGALAAERWSNSHSLSVSPRSAR